MLRRPTLRLGLVVALSIPVAAAAARAGVERGGPEALERNDVTEVMKGARKPFADCYREALGREPGAGGKVTLEFTVNPDGKVGEAEVAGTSFGDPQLHRCLLRVVRTLRFKAWAGSPAKITYPLVFKPEDAGAAPKAPAPLRRPR